MSEETTPKLAEQYKTELQALEGLIADALIDFTARTGFVVEDIQPFHHDYRSAEPYYSVSVTVQL